jgi:voltage-gated potassium channel Kch
MLKSVLKTIEAMPFNKLTVFIIAIGMLLAAQIQYIQHGWINPDSVLYLEAAKLFAKNQWQAGFAVFSWPFYSILIAATHKISTLSVHLSAQLLSVIFFGITTASFLKIIHLAGGKSMQLLAGGFVLVSAKYLMGDVMEMLMRDQGFWAFYLAGIGFFIQFYKTNLFKYAALWQTSIILATLFRIEAITFLFFMPFLILLCKTTTLQERLKSFIKCNLIHISLATIIIATLMLNPHLSTKVLGRLNEVFSTNLYNELTKNLHDKSSIMSTLVLGRYLNEFAIPGLLLTFIYVMIVKTFSATGLVNMALAWFSLKSKQRLLDKEVSLVLGMAAVIAIINMGLIITKIFVLSSRYVVALSFIIMLFSSFYLAKLLVQFIKENHALYKKNNWFLLAVLLLMSVSLINNILPKQQGYNYLQDAVSWVQANNKNNKPVFYDEPRARYYANEPFIGSWPDDWEVVKKAIENNSINNYEHLIINHSTKHPEREKLLIDTLENFDEVKRFSNPKANNFAVVYQKKST